MMHCRLHQLVTRYNDVDPGEHRLLESKNKETESNLVAANEALIALQAKVKIDEKNKKASSIIVAP